MEEYLSLEECLKVKEFFTGGYKLVTEDEIYEYSEEEKILSVTVVGSDIGILADSLTIEAIKRGKLVKR